MSCPIPFHFSHIADYIYDFCFLPDPDVGLSILVMLSILLSILVWAAACLLCACLVKIAGSTQELRTPIGVRDGGAGGAAAPPIRAVCRHEFGQRVDIIRAKHNTCLNNTNLGSVTGVKGKKHEFRVCYCS